MKLLYISHINDVWTDAMALIVVPTAMVLMECVIVMEEATAETDVKRLMYAMEFRVVLMELVD